MSRTTDGRCGRRQGKNAFCAQRTGGFGQFEVIGAKVVAPLRNAVRLINGEQADFHLPYQAQKPLVVEAFGRDIKQFQRAGAHIGGHLLRFLRRQRRVQAGGADAVTAQKIYLVFHQGDERRHDKRDAFEGQGGQLVAQRFAAARRKHGQRRALPHQGVNHGFLTGPELYRSQNAVAAAGEASLPLARGLLFGGLSHVFRIR